MDTLPEIDDYFLDHLKMMLNKVVSYRIDPENAIHRILEIVMKRHEND